MPCDPAFLGHARTRITTRSKLGCLLAGALCLPACFPGDLTSRDFSEFQSYQFEQTPALGFCPDAEQVFGATIARGADGALSFTHSVLSLAGPDPLDCEDGLPAEDGCFRPEAQPERTLTAQEAESVETTFAEVNYHRRPDKVCRDMGIDPCMIERHAWDADAFSNFICGADRLTAQQSGDIRALLTILRDGG